MAGDRNDATTRTLDYVGNLAKKKVSPVVVDVILLVLFYLTEEFFIEGAFRCPCKEILDQECSAPPTYSALFIAIPAFAIFLLSLMAQWALKCVFGKINEVCCRVEYTNGICSWIFQALFLTGGWLAIILIDGHYIACAATCPPYEQSRTCDQIRMLSKDDLPFSTEYRENLRISQYIGLSLALAIILLYGGIILCKHCACGRCSCSGCTSCCGGRWERKNNKCMLIKCCWCDCEYVGDSENGLQNLMQNHVNHLIDNAGHSGTDNQAFEVWERSGLFKVKKENESAGTSGQARVSSAF